MRELRDAQVVIERNNGLTFQAIAGIHGISVERARQVYKRAVKRMGKMYIEPERDSRFYRVAADSSDRRSAVAEVSEELLRRYERARDEYFAVQDELNLLYLESRKATTGGTEALT